MNWLLEQKLVDAIERPLPALAADAGGPGLHGAPLRCSARGCSRPCSAISQPAAFRRPRGWMGASVPICRRAARPERRSLQRAQAAWRSALPGLRHRQGQRACPGGSSRGLVSAAAGAVGGTDRRRPRPTAAGILAAPSGHRCSSHGRQRQTPPLTVPATPRLIPAAGEPQQQPAVIPEAQRQANSGCPWRQQTAFRGLQLSAKTAGRSRLPCSTRTISTPVVVG